MIGGVVMAVPCNLLPHGNVFVIQYIPQCVFTAASLGFDAFQLVPIYSSLFPGHAAGILFVCPGPAYLDN